MEGGAARRFDVEGQQPSSHPSVADGDLHVWTARLERSEHDLAELRRVLSPDERARADRFHRNCHAAHFVTARAILRMLLAGYLGTAPHEVSFDYTAHGRPVLRGGAHLLRFSLSHSSGAALYVFAWGRNVGVDLERIQSDRAVLEIARRFFAAEEIEALCAEPCDKRANAFYRCWTRKEAYLKARGLGLSMPLDAFSVSLRQSEPAALLSNRLDPEEPARWSFVDLPIFSDYAAALVVERPKLGVATRLTITPFPPCDPCVPPSYAT